MKLKLHLVFFGFLVTGMNVVAAPDAVSIVEHITVGTENQINQPDKLLERLMIEEGVVEDEGVKNKPKSKNGKIAGYRVQVFSDNNTRTAKNEARNKQRSIAGRFPRYQTYVMYTSPYWRLKVGDFRTQEEAQEAANEIGRAFPAFKKEIRVVRDRVNIVE